jgi:Dolichyl-phosphate-mannose-protein mannosyltransferase
MLTNVVIFGICLIVYWLNGPYAIASSDSWPTSLLAFNLLENHTFHFDLWRSTRLFEGLRTPYFLVESASGHLTSAYPIGTSILTFPLYLVFFLIVKVQAILQGHPVVDLTTDSFFLTRLFYEKAAASILAALTVVFFYRSVRLNFPRWIAALTSLIFAFATSMWVISAQALWQHGPIVFLTTLSLWALLKANQVPASQCCRYLLLVGIACGLLPGIRPTTILLCATIVAYSGYSYRQQALWLLPGLTLSLPSLIWNLYYFGDIKGGYDIVNQAAIAYGIQPYAITPRRLVQGFISLLFSPSRGLFVFSPIVLYGLLGIKPLWRQRRQPDAPLILGLTIAAGILFASYCAYFMWWAGACYGPRFLVDTLPVLCYLISYQLATMPKLRFFGRQLWQWGLFTIALVYTLSGHYLCFLK